jgi:hypothetical protein
MGKAAMDLELLDPKVYRGADSPKYEAAAKEIVAGVASGGQVVFADNIAVHDKMAAKLAALGIARNQIAIINAQVAATSAARQNIADAFNAGKLKVVIGNTATMGEGINLQKATTDIHHMDLPWEPASVQQRNGRGLRQGNKMESVRLHTYLSKGSFDGYRYQAILAKKDWQDLLWNGGDRVENLARAGNVSRDDMMIMLAADPDEARKQYDANKAAAQQRYEADQHSKAAGEFDRYQEMKVSFRALKNKGTPAANRLRVKLERAKAALADSKFFSAKHALDSDNAIVIQPKTGMAFESRTAFELADTPDTPVKGGGKFIVTHVNPRHKQFYARRYGTIGGTPIGFDVAKLENGVTTFKHDEEAEKVEIARELEDSAKSKMDSVSKMEDLVAMPHSVLEGAYEPLQRQIKAGMKEYKFHHPYGSIGLIGPDGNARAAESYEARDLVSEKDGRHDVMLPIPAHREKAIDAFLESERGKEFTHTYHSGRRGKTVKQFVARYPGRYGQHSNPWSSIGRTLFGDDFERDARARLEREQLEKARHANTFGDAVADAAKTAHTGQYGGHVTWPKRSIAVMWAKAKHDGKLDDPLKSAIPRMPDEVFSVRQYSDYGEPVSVVNRPVRDALVDLAIGNKHYDLAAAMIASGYAPAKAAEKLVDLGSKAPKVATAALRHLVGKHPSAGETKVRYVFARDRSSNPYHREGTVNEVLAQAEESGDDRAAA